MPHCGQDLGSVDQLAVLFAQKTDARSRCDGKPDVVTFTALRNSGQRGGYLILAARLLGLGRGPMSGLDAARVDRESWAGSTVHTHFLCPLGRRPRRTARAAATAGPSRRLPASRASPHGRGSLNDLR